MNRYLIVIEETPKGYSAYSPDVPGCIATSRDRAEVVRAMRDAIAFHIDGLRDHELPVHGAREERRAV